MGTPRVSIGPYITNTSNLVYMITHTPVLVHDQINRLKRKIYLFHSLFEQNEHYI